jgi:phosphopantetheinyl transferase
MELNMKAINTNKCTFSALLFITVFLLVNIHAVIAQSETKITTDDAAAQDCFGYSVSISGDYAVVGAYQDDDGGYSSGSAYIFVRDGDDWTQQAKLTTDDAAVEDHFGWSVSISGDYAVVGAHGDDDDGEASGSAYIFVCDGANWIEQAKLTADDATGGDYFGFSVSISGDYAVVGAHLDDDGGDCSGSAYIFVRDGTDWTEQAKLTADDAAERDFLGWSVSISGDYTVVGAWRDDDDDDGEDSGSAYIYNLGENNIEWRGDMTDLPVDFSIVSAYPNPFNSAIRIGFNLKSAHEVALQALDVQGRVIADINQGYYQAGQHQITWDAQSIQSGLYFIRLTASGKVFTQKVMLIR